MANENGDQDFLQIPRPNNESKGKTLGVALGSAVAGAVFAQAANLFLWGTTLGPRLDALEKTVIDIRRDLSRVDAEGSRRLPLVIQQTDDLKTRVERIVQALDNTYNLLNEHLRASNTDSHKVILIEERQRVVIERLNAIDRALGKVSPPP